MMGAERLRDARWMIFLLIAGMVCLGMGNGAVFQIMYYPQSG
jgi:hypothetical protein